MNQDWPNLRKYKAENEILKSIESDSNRIVLMGDSITEFWLKLNPDFFESNSYINRGISGQTTPQMLIRFRADVIDLKPSIVVIHAGINDIAGNTGPATIDMIVNNIYSMVELAKSNNIKIILCALLPAYDFPWKSNQFPAEKIIEFNSLIQKYAFEHSIVYLDYYAAMVNKQLGMIQNYTDDSVHPNKNGYAIMEPLLENAIKLTLE